MFIGLFLGFVVGEGISPATPGEVLGLLSFPQSRFREESHIDETTSVHAGCCRRRAEQDDRRQPGP